MSIRPEGIARRVMTLFFMIDVSGSMEGIKIGAVNQAIQEVIPELREMSEKNADAEIKVAALTFSNGAVWVTSAPQSVENFYWNDVSAGGMTDFGAACKLLVEKLDVNGFMGHASGSYAPAIFLMSDGGANDDYKSPLEELRKNPWFAKAIKVAVAIGDDADKNMLCEFTGSSEAVLESHSVESLKQMIHFVSVTSSQIGSHSAGIGAGAAVDAVESKQDAMIKQIQQSGISYTDEGDTSQF